MKRKITKNYVIYLLKIFKERKYGVHRERDTKRKMTIEGKVSNEKEQVAVSRSIKASYIKIIGKRVKQELETESSLIRSDRENFRLAASYHYTAT